MKFLRKWLLNSLRKASAEESQQNDIEADYGDSIPNPMLSSRSAAKIRRGLVSSRDCDIDLPDGGLNIQVKSAIGGKIVIFRTYDDRTDRNSYSTYLIPDSESFQDSLGKIITMESLKL